MMARIIVAVLLFAASAVALGKPASPDLIVVSSEAAGHTALLAQPGTSFPVPVSELKDVSAAVLKLFNVDGIDGSLLGRRLPRALLMIVVGGVASEMLTDADFPNLSAILEDSPKSLITTIPEPRNFDNMVKTALSTKELTLTQQFQSAFRNQAKMSISSASEFVCNLALGCDAKSSNMDILISAIDGTFQNQVLLFAGNRGQSFQLDTSDQAINAFLNEVAMIMANPMQSSDSSAPTFISVTFSTLQPILDEFGIQSKIAAACLHVLDVAIPKIMESFRTAFSERAEVAILLLPPSHDAYMTEEIRQIIVSVNGDASPSSAFVYLSDGSSVAVVQKRLSARLPMNFQIFNFESKSSSQSDVNPALYQITLWVSIMLVVLVIVSTGALCCGEIRKDTLLYSKIAPSNDKKNR